MTLLSRKRVIAEIRMPLRVRTSSPCACAIGALRIVDVATEGWLCVRPRWDESKASLSSPGEAIGEDPSNGAVTERHSSGLWRHVEGCVLQ